MAARAADTVWGPTSMSDKTPSGGAGRIALRKTYKLYVGGAFPRSESGRTYEVTDSKGRFLANAAMGSRKDARDAVVAARKAFHGWSAATAYNRGQVLYRVAELMEGRRAQFVEEVAAGEGLTARRADAVIDAAIDRWVWYAGWSDKVSAVPAPWCCPDPLPTPVLAYAILRLGCAAGVMVTASHNPPQDNGYKVYLGSGSQIVPPADAEISAAIDAVARLADVPRGKGWTVAGDDLLDAYVAAVVGQSLTPARDLRVVYTPLHGVGRDVLLRAFAQAGFAPPVVVAEQGSGPGLPDRGVPQPGGAGGDGPGAGARC